MGTKNIFIILINFFLAMTTAELSAQSFPGIALVKKASNLDKPTHVTNAGDGSRRIFVTEQAGKIIILKGFVPLETPFLDIRSRVSCCGERGLLSAVFPAGYRDKRYFYVNYTDRRGDTTIARYRVSGDPDRADAGSEEIILVIKQPFSNHNGGLLAFGPDGYLYIGMGDGGAAGDPFGNGQNRSSLLGKILRIDVESGLKPYSIPAGNPFAGKSGYRPEIWALGLRNPWKFCFDRITGDLYIADVGQNLYEEINFQPGGSPGGENYGWNIMEGLHCFGSEQCRTAGLSLPVAEYDHNKGCSVTGGMVYRGRGFPSLKGIYLYSDYCSGRIWGLGRTGGQWWNRELANSGLSVSTFGEDEEGELYVADYSGGGLYRIEPAQKSR